MSERKDFSYRSLGLEVADYLKNKIFLEEYRGGDRILEAQVAAELNISRAPVREALKELENQGLIKNIPRKGSFVVDFTREDFEEIYEIRIMLESRILEKLIREKMLKSEDFDHLKEIIDQMVELVSRGQQTDERILDFNKKDMEFHRFLWEKSARKWSVRILSNLHHQLKLAMIMDSKLENNLTAASRVHYELLDSLQQGDLEGCKEILVRHIAALYQGAGGVRD